MSYEACDFCDRPYNEYEREFWVEQGSTNHVKEESLGRALFLCGSCYAEDLEFRRGRIQIKKERKL